MSFMDQTKPMQEGTGAGEVTEVARAAAQVKVWFGREADGAWKLLRVGRRLEGLDSTRILR
jgi:hypothetical protein